jgi:chitosanase
MPIGIQPAQPPKPVLSNPSLTTTQKTRAEALTSLFENGTPVVQYDYAENLHDGRGITVGRAGFTTGTEDAQLVVERYTKLIPQNPLARFLPRLQQISKAPENSAARASTVGLVGFAAAWKLAAKDARFKAAQDAEVNATYYVPSQRLADKLGLQTPLARGQLYDAIIQHGEGTDPDGLPALINRANKAAGGSPAQGVDEKKWFSAFLSQRRKDLEHSFNTSSRKEWADSVDRVGVYEDLVRVGNWQLNGPIKVNHGDFKGTIS